MLRKVEFAPGEYYHLYNRGTDRRKIFLLERDWLRFQVLLYVANNTEVVHISNYESLRQGRSLMKMFDINRPATLVDVGAYCLMPNHFHLLVKEKMDGGITTFIRKLLTGYSMYFNIRHHRTGALFESRFRAQHVADDQYLRYLFAYIHLNPVKKLDPKNWKDKVIPNPTKALKFLETYHYSSFPYYLGQKRPENVIINPADFPGYFAGVNDFKNFIKDWAEYEPE